MADFEFDRGSQSALSGIGYTPENSANKATDFSVLNNVKYPSTQAVANYVAASTVGLYDDRGNYDASPNTFPATGGSGTAGAILKGDIWTVSVFGTLGGTPSPVGSTVRALTDTPGQTAGNWAIVRFIGANPIISVKTTAYPLTTEDSLTIFTNEGAGASVAFTLPTAVAGLSYEFAVIDADGLSVVAGAGDVIRISTSETPAAGNVSSTTIGSSLRLVALNDTLWMALSVSGTWVVSS